MPHHPPTDALATATNRLGRHCRVVHERADRVIDAHLAAIGQNRAAVLVGLTVEIDVGALELLVDLASRASRGDAR